MILCVSVWISSVFVLVFMLAVVTSTHIESKQNFPLGQIEIYLDLQNNSYLYCVVCKQVMEHPWQERL